MKWQVFYTKTEDPIEEGDLRSATHPAIVAVPSVHTRVWFAADLPPGYNPTRQGVSIVYSSGRSKTKIELQARLPSTFDS